MVTTLVVRPFRIAVLASSRREFMRFLVQEVPEYDRELYVQIMDVEQLDNYDDWYSYMEVGHSFELANHAELIKAMQAAITRCIKT